MAGWSEFLRDPLGLAVRPEAYGALQLCLRALAMYAAGLVLIRLAKNRFLGKSTAFDVIFGFIWGSMLSRGINGAGPLGPTMAAGAAMLGLHWAVGWIATRSATVYDAVNGKASEVVAGGRVLPAARRAQLADATLQEALRQHGVDAVAAARRVVLERNGSFSVLKSPAPPRVIELPVREGVHTVRIELGGP